MSDRLFGLVAVLAGVAYLVGSWRIPASFLTDPFGPRVFPLIVGSVAVLCGIAIMIRPDTSPRWPDLTGWTRQACALAILIAYALTLRPGGFLLPTAVAAAVLSYQIKARPIAAVVTGVSISLFLFAVFKFALDLGLKALPSF